jgi:hypothetical protein
MKPIAFNRRTSALLTAIGSILAAALVAGSLLALSGCAFVHQRDREFLSDPVMQRHDDGLEATLEGHDMPRREGSVGGSSGSGGGCGC